MVAPWVEKEKTLLVGDEGFSKFHAACNVTCFYESSRHFLGKSALASRNESSGNASWVMKERASWLIVGQAVAEVVRVPPNSHEFGYKNTMIWK
jgi:hypothetical protein